MYKLRPIATGNFAAWFVSLLRKTKWLEENETIDVKNVQLKTKKTLKNVKNVTKILKTFVNVIKNVTSS